MASFSFLNSRPLSSSSPNLRHRSVNELQQLDLIQANSTPSNSIVHIPDSSEPTAQLASLLEDVQIDSNISNENLPSPIAMISTDQSPIQLASDPENSMLDDEEFTEHLKELINRFIITRSDSHRAFYTTIRWTVDHGNHINYSVVIRIGQPAYLV